MPRHVAKVDLLRIMPSRKLKLMPMLSVAAKKRQKNIMLVIMKFEMNYLNNKIFKDKLN